MKNSRKIITIFLSAFVIAFSFSIFNFSNYMVKAESDVKIQEKQTDKGEKANAETIILIDPGHGGFDGGAETKNGTIEKDINLKISLKLKEKLEAQGFKVVMTRMEDKGLYSPNNKNHKKREDLENRCKLKKESKCDIFLSIHMNEFHQEKYYGAQVWYSDYQESKNLAHVLQDNLKLDLDKENNRVEKAAKNNYKILRSNDNMPSVIVECGFLSNYKEEQKLINEQYQQKICDSICKSICLYNKTR